MAVLTNPTYYAYGEGGYSSVIGYESSRNRVVRFKFSTGSSGATSISISVSAGTISYQQGTEQKSIPFYVTTSSTSHANANGADGVAVTGYINGSNGNAYTGSANVVLKANTDYYLWFFPKSKTYGWSFWHCNSYYTTDCTTSGTSKFSLSISAGTGSTITVKRTSSAAGLSTGNLSNGATIYKNDKLQISFAANTNYALKTRTVNGSTFTSGSTHTVSGNVTVASTAQVLASNVGATNANIGSVSTITVTKYNPTYYHTLQYSFGNLSGYITSSGGVSTSASKFSGTSVAFTIPSTFYAQIPNSKTGKCTITCKTYSSSSSTTQLGNATTCQITVTATGAPTVSGTVVDTNATTIALTGDANKLIRYKSTAVATISASGNNSATIASKYINNVVPNSSNQRTFSRVSATSFVFKATDSRGYQATKTVSPTMVDYINLTLNPVISRPTPTGSEITMTFTGDYYRGSFGAYSNTLKIQYRYRESSSTTWSSWTTIASTNYTISTQTYTTSSPISLGTNFDYQKAYMFQVRATDGTADYTLSTVTKAVTVQRGIPVFDWGEEDFEFHVNVKISDGTLKIGNTTITEAQLQSLLALL